MMVVDSSAIVAILLDESDSDTFIAAFARTEKSCMSAVNVHETAVVLRRHAGDISVELTWQFLAQYGIDVIPFDEAQAKVAAAAYARFGKGIDSKAKLNLADRAAYALAKSLGAPLLFKGRDFTATDIGSALSTS